MRSQGKAGLLSILWPQALLLLAFSLTAEAQVVHVTLNKLEIGIDERTGSIVSLGSPYTGLTLSAAPASAGLLDVAYPVESYAAMRLASRFSAAKVSQSGDEVIITWERLGASRPNLALPSGGVRAQVTIRAADDGRSVIFRSVIENDSKAPVRQVLFPDLWGLKPFAGVKNTRLRLARGVATPFDEPLKPAGSTPFYAVPPSPLAWKEYPAGGYYNENSLRWLDYGGFQSGLSVFQKKWGTYDWPNVITRRSERDPMSLRMAWEHRPSIKPGERWDSGEFWFTPHAGGWAKGIEVYRDYVSSVNPPRVLPKHVAEDLAYQTIWMIQTVEVDPAKADFRYEDLPRIAEDARRYGVHELVPWGWCTYSTMPIPIRSELGSVEELLRGVQQARQVGVNVAPFISLSIVRNQYAARYGVEPSNADWTYHYELIPEFRPYYTDFWNGVAIDSNNEIWRKDVLAALSDWIDKGIGSFVWDVYRVHPSKQAGEAPPLLTLTDKVRSTARSKYPQSTFAGESVSHLELDSRTLDYLWNWTAYEDAGPISNVLRAPRVSCNIEDSALLVAKCFADNLYINAMPRQLDAPNGTALISDEPELASALLKAAKLREQFLDYFTKGTFIGDSVLNESSSAFARAYVLDDRMLVIVLNDKAKAQSLSVESDLSLWLPAAESYQVTAFDQSGSRLGSAHMESSHWFGATKPLKQGQMMLFEIESK